MTTRSINIQDLLEYLDCSEYYFQRRVKNNTYPPYTDKTNFQLLVKATVNNLIYAVYTQGNIDDNSILTMIAAVQSRLQQDGREIKIDHTFNDTLLSIFQLRDYLLTIKLTKTFDPQILSIHGVNISYVNLAEDGKDTIYIFNHLPIKHFLNSLYFLLPFFNHPDKKFKMIFLNSNTRQIEIRDIKKQYNIKNGPRLRRHLKGIATYIKSNIYMPILNCNRINCLHYNKCNIVRKLK